MFFEAGALGLVGFGDLFHLEVAFDHAVDLFPEFLVLAGYIFDSEDKLILFDFVEFGHLVDIIIKLFFEDHDLVEEELLLFCFYFVDGVETFLLVFLSLIEHVFYLLIFLGQGL